MVKDSISIELSIDMIENLEYIVLCYSVIIYNFFIIFL